MQIKLMITVKSPSPALRWRTQSCEFARHSVSVCAGGAVASGIAGADTDTYVTPVMPGILPDALTALVLARTPLL